MQLCLTYLSILVCTLGFHTQAIYGNFGPKHFQITEIEKNKETKDTIPQHIKQLQNKVSFIEETSSNAIDYLGLATNFLEAENFKSALDASLIAYYLAIKEEDIEVKVNALIVIAQINVFWENAETGLLIYNRVDELLAISDIDVELRFKLLILLGKSNAALKLGNPDAALSHINKAFEYAASKQEGTTYNEFVWNSGIAYFQKREYQRAFDSLDKASKNASSIYFEMLTNYYRAEHIITSGNTDEAISFYLEIDSILEKNNIAFPERKEIYESINDYYKNKGDRVSQFLFINKFLKELNIYMETYGYISKTTNELYEIPKLIREKQTEIDKLQAIKNRNTSFIIFISLLSLVLIMLLFSQLRKNKIYKKRFDGLMSNKRDIITTETDSGTQELSIEVISDILQKLEEFETNNMFLDKNISLHKTSKQFNTNSTYLSKVVNIKKDKNFSNYINQLRIEYCLELLKKDKKILNYTIKAIAEEAGFNNAQSFSNAFYKFTGIYPSYFVEQLKKADKN